MANHTTCPASGQTYGNYRHLSTYVPNTRRGQVVPCPACHKPVKVRQSLGQAADLMIPRHNRPAREA